MTLDHVIESHTIKKLRFIHQAESRFSSNSKDRIRILANWENDPNSDRDFKKLLKSHMISVITPAKTLPDTIQEPK